MGLGCVKTLARGGEASASRLGGAEGALCWGWLGPHRGHERMNAHDVHDTGKIVGQHVQRHLGRGQLPIAQCASEGRDGPLCRSKSSNNRRGL